MKKTIPLLLLVALVFSACHRDHFITDPEYRSRVQARFKVQKALAVNRSEQLFGVMDHVKSLKEKEAMMSLYAYMPLSDLADYNGEFFLENVRASFAARDTFSWGKTVPEALFRHFVLPIRVNNENLDSSRWIFMAELKDRIKNLSMTDAALEVNHWCHEKVTYKGSDGRTSSPLATVRTANGRCGEESTFTVAALRAVGIPARQCYTPRWAHSDDNHAWVEVWTDGAWHYLGACEPEPVLDMAWFTKPAKRAMLVNTTVFGDYTGPEEVLEKGDGYTRINLLSNYAATKKIHARILDREGKPADSALVEFQLYNYAEFYPLYKGYTDKEGFAAFTTGFGDLLVWAAKNNYYGFAKIDIRKSDTVDIRLDRQPGDPQTLDLDLVPPVELPITVVVSDSLRKINDERLTHEDQLRNGYEQTFIDSAMSVRLAAQAGLDADTLWYFLHKSRGNWRPLAAFVTGLNDAQRPLFFPLLANLSEKDLRDVDTAVISDALSFSGKIPSDANEAGLFPSCILTPRIDNEYLKPWKKYFRERFGESFISKAGKDPALVEKWVNDSIVINTVANYGRAPLTPVGAFELRVADLHSRDILLVALMRSFGIPSRLDPASRIPKYFHDGRWIDAAVGRPGGPQRDRGKLTFVNPKENDRKPEYIIHYTLEEYKDGFFRTLDYEGSPLVQNYPCTLDIAAGPYLMVTGSRLPDGTVLAKLDFFSLPASGNISRDIILRKDLAPLPVFGTVDMKKLTGIQTSRGLIIAYIEPDKEPTKHLLADLVAKSAEFSAWKGSVCLVCRDEQEAADFRKKAAKDLPAGTRIVSEGSFIPKQTFIAMLPSTANSLPLVLFISESGKVNYAAEGYRIGTADELLRVINFR